MPHDAAAWQGPNGPYPRYAPNLNHRRRILANPSARSITFEFAKIELNPQYHGGMRDELQLGWYGQPPQVTLSGWAWPAGTPAAIGMVAGLSLENPGVLFRFRSGPAVAAWNLYQVGESEGGGYITGRIRLNGNGTWITSMRVTLSPHELVTGVLLDAVNGRDYVDMRLASVTTPVTVALWLDEPNSPQVYVYARCNAPPENNGAWDASAQTASESGSPGRSGAFLDLPVCSANWYVRVFSPASTQVRVFHLQWGAHYPSREYSAPGERIGIAYDASPADLQAIKNAFQEAAWRFYGATDGGYLIRSFQYYNNISSCAGWPGQNCGGATCRFCVHPQSLPCTTSWWNGFSQVFICYNHRTQPDLIAHEMGHVYIGLRDNYANLGSTTSCPSSTVAGVPWSLCGHSMMSILGDNRNGFCTELGHRTNLLDWRGFPTSRSYPSSINGPYLYDCAGGWHWTDHAAEWSALSGAHVPTTHPPDWSPHNETFGGFRRNSRLGNPVDAP